MNGLIRKIKLISNLKRHNLVYKEYKKRIEQEKYFLKIIQKMRQGD